MKRKIDDWIAGFLKYTENTEPPRSYREWIAVSVISSVLQRKCRLEWGHITFYPNLYIVLVGPSGKCRKGTAMGVGASMLRDMGVKMASEAITREALIRELKKANSSTVDPETQQMLLHASLTIYSQELTVFLGYNNVQLMSDLTDWYDCRDRWTYRTKHQGTDEIIGVWVNLIGATTPELIQSALPHDAIGGGLSSRIIFVYEEDKGKIVPAPFLTKEDDQLRKDLLSDLEQISMVQGDFTISESFLERWVDWYSSESVPEIFKKDPRFSGYISRRPTHILKLCLILSASVGISRELTVDIFNRALDLLTRTEINMPHTFRGMGRSDISEVMSRVSAEIATEGRVTFAELLRRFYYDADKETMERVVGTLSAMDFCRIITKGTEAWIEYIPDKSD